MNSIVGTSYNPGDAPFLDPNQQNIARVYLWRNTGTDVLTSGTNLIGKFFTGDVAHKVTGGFDYTRYATGADPGRQHPPIPAPVAVQHLHPTYGRNLYYLNFGTGGLVSS
ncbi:MAG: hypothetical protein ACKVP3_01210 [Hyphomicrobiaceae bacterium]